MERRLARDKFAAPRGRNSHQVHAHALQVDVVCGQLTHGGGELDLHLDLRAQLLYLAPRLVVLPPHQLDDGGGEGEADEDVKVADDEVRVGQLNVCKKKFIPGSGLRGRVLRFSIVMPVV